MESTKNEKEPEDFVTVVSVEQPKVVESFVTVLSIGTKNQGQTNSNDKNLDEEVEVYRLPGERLGFGLKFEGGNKTAEKVRRLFVQSCAEQSPASRVKCSWGSLGERDEILSIDGVPVIHMSRLDCVQRLKESQLVIKLLVRHQGALKPEIINAERKLQPEKCKIPPELPPMPPPVPPRKLRQARGSADGDANPSPVKKHNQLINGQRGANKSTNIDANNNSNLIISKEITTDVIKLKKEPTEAMNYLDATSQDGSSTHGSTSDDTASSKSTVVDKLSICDKLSLSSTTSDIINELSSNESHKLLESFEQLDNDFCTNPDYLLKRLVNCETNYTEINEKTKNNGITEETTLTLQPPINFQDNPYSQDKANDIYYTADLAADSTTHFRPIRDDASIVECVNGDVTFDTTKETLNSIDTKNFAPPLPARNHINRISVNQINDDTNGDKKIDTDVNIDMPILPPKPLPRKDSKLKRKRLPPPPPPPTAPRRDIPPQVSARNLDLCKTKLHDTQLDVEDKLNDNKVNDDNNNIIDNNNNNVLVDDDDDKNIMINNEKNKNNSIENSSMAIELNNNELIFNESLVTKKNNDTSMSIDKKIGESQNKIFKKNNTLEIIEMKKMKVYNDSSKNNNNFLQISPCQVINDDNKEEKDDDDDNYKENLSKKDAVVFVPAPRNSIKMLSSLSSLSTTSSTLEDEDEDDGEKSEESIDVWEEARDVQDDDDDNLAIIKTHDIVDEENYESFDTIEDETEIPRVICVLKDIHGNEEVETRFDSEGEEEDDDEEDNGDDYYWQSNLATIGEEEETNSLEYTSVALPLATLQVLSKQDGTKILMQKEPDKKQDNRVVNGRMDNCGGGQRLPPDGDEFPAAYQEFSTSAQQYQQYIATQRNTSTMTSNGTSPSPSSASLSSSSVVVVVVNHDDDHHHSIYENNKKPEAVQSIDQHELNNHSYGPTSIKDSTMKNTEILHENDNLNSMKFINKYSPRDNKNNTKIINEKSLLLSEKKIEISGYYPKDVKANNHDDVKVDISILKDYCDNQPPPLPLTGPPKMDKPMILGKSLSVDNTNKKYSSDLRRQDDKSEKSVRDKIAMFSSQCSLESPLFPNTPVTNTINTNTTKRLSKYKSSEDFFSEDHNNYYNNINQQQQQHMQQVLKDRTLSSYDLTDSGKNLSSSIELQSSGNYIERLPSLPRTLPPEESFNHTSIYSKGHIDNLTTQKSNLLTDSINSSDVKSIFNSSKLTSSSATLSSAVSHQDISKISSINLTRAISFSGGISHGNTNELPPTNNGQISRANSLASTFKRTSEDMRRTSLNQLIEQRKKGISKLRGLVIPEKIDIPNDQPIIDLPEIKSRDSILIQQRANIQDKWGSQSSLASNTSTQSMPMKTTSFKIPAPQILPKYSPAFKRKSLAVYGNSTTTTTSPDKQSNVQTTPTIITEPPKSLESIYSPTRSDYSFEYVSSVSPENQRNRPCITQRKNHTDYDDSDNDSAVSSSQSSISRGFSPPSSPVPSERSNLSSERSYQMIMEIPRNYLTPDRTLQYNNSNNKTTHYTNDNIYNNEQNMSSSGGGSSNSSNDSNSSSSSSSSSSCCGNSNPRTPPPPSTGTETTITTTEHNSRYSVISQRQLLKRSSSTETNCSTSSTLTSGSQASAESLSRRVLKPQSVEAINRKNILASARCRSGRDLNGSPLIQRKFSDDENTHDNKNYKKIHEINGNNIENIKIAYITDVNDTIDYQINDKDNIKIKESKLTPKRTQSLSCQPSIKNIDIVESSNDLKNWIRTEAKVLIEENKLNYKDNELLKIVPRTRIPRTRSALCLNEINTTNIITSLSKRVPSNESINNDKKQLIDTINDDLITTLTTKSRCRAPINFKDSTVTRSRSQISIDDILAGKNIPKPLPRLNNSYSNRLSTDTKIPLKYSSNDSSTIEDKLFVSKIPTYGKSKIEMIDEPRGFNERSKIPIQKSSLARRSSSVTDVKKAVEKSDHMENNNQQQQQQQIQGGHHHHRFSSLDSSVEDNNNNCQSIGIDVMEQEKFYSEQFGSISSLASSTSLISQQELAQLVEEASLEESRGLHDVIVVLLHKENPNGSVGITLAGGVDCEAKEITIHRVLSHSIADKDGRVQRGDRILSINGKSTRGLNHRESLAVLKQPRSEIVLVVSRPRIEEGNKLKTRTESVETIVEGFEVNGVDENISWGPATKIKMYKDGAGLGFSLEGGRDSPLGDRVLLIKKIFTGGAAEKTGALTAGDQLLEVNGTDVTRMSRIEAWSIMKKLKDGEVSLVVRHPAIKSS
ncbi:hypothetical protein HCN44_008530 [Aphidius gifuensis]|uniref:PDZ domain-containing protein n=1 Tax=Aphidius gifuensis TaxID=684658 RepID=A0A834XPQ7_APHGI|nr:hypothetical protein HCN44_008530 [Aphidius gifuensis]